MNNSKCDTIRNRFFYFISLLISLFVNVSNERKILIVVFKEVAVALNFLDLFGYSLKKGAHPLENAEVTVFHDRLTNRGVNEENKGSLKRLRNYLITLNLD